MILAAVRTSLTSCLAWQWMRGTRFCTYTLYFLCTPTKLANLTEFLYPSFMKRCGSEVLIFTHYQNLVIYVGEKNSLCAGDHTGATLCLPVAGWSLKDMPTATLLPGQIQLSELLVYEETQKLGVDLRLNLI